MSRCYNKHLFVKTHLKNHPLPHVTICSKPRPGLAAEKRKNNPPLPFLSEHANQSLGIAT